MVVWGGGGGGGAVRPEVKVAARSSVSPVLAVRPTLSICRDGVRSLLVCAMSVVHPHDNGSIARMCCPKVTMRPWFEWTVGSPGDGVGVSFDPFGLAQCRLYGISTQ